MHCIWDVCVREKSATVFREDVMEYCDAHSSFLSRQEIDEGHRSAFTTIGPANHYVKVYKKYGLIELRPKGIRFCQPKFPGDLLQDEL